MIHSLDRDVHSSDPNRLAAIRGFTVNDFFGPQLCRDPARQRVQGARICAVPLDLAIQITLNKIETGTIVNSKF